MFFSIIIPLYNEEKRLPKNANRIFDFFKNFSCANEIIFVNDGSTDNTLNILKDYQKNNNFEIVSYEVNHGKGYAVRQGVKRAKGDALVFFDVDLAVPLEKMDDLVKNVLPDDKVIIGSRRLELSAIKRSEPKLRTFLGQGFTKLSNILVPGVTDFTCGFKCFTKDAAQSIFGVARIDRWGFDTELLYIAKLKKLRIREIPVSWTHDSDSRVDILQSIKSSLKELLEIKMNQIKGCYK